MAQSTRLEEEWDTGKITSTYYWTHWSRFLEDGMFEIKTSWYTEDGTHMTGFTKIAPKEPDYKLWQWVVQRCEAGIAKLDDIVSNETLDDLRAEFEALT